MTKTEIVSKGNFWRLVNLVQSDINYWVQIDGRNSIDNFYGTYFVVINRFSPTWSVQPTFYYYDGSKYKSIFYFDDLIKKSEYDSVYYNLMEKLNLIIGKDVPYANQSIVETHKGCPETSNINCYGSILKKTDYCCSEDELW